MISVLAVFEKGVLRPTEPLDLKEGQNVQLSVYPQLPLQPLPAPTPEEEDYGRRLKAARSLEEIHAVMATAPPLPEGYDLSEALNANRLATGERLLYAASASKEGP
jgi:predicted DNA-binding antitoxin AbrB/MazE fold protein